MAPLPANRLRRPPAPFANVGVDFTGPLAVSCRRSQVKRWICLFTCLATRAVHIEVCHSLDTNSFLSAFRRFTARRGTPSDFYSDNGTNFVAAARVLGATGQKSSAKRRITAFMATRGVTWHFNPPLAPHFGGVWERLIRTAKLALGTTLHGQRITDEILLTILVEIESMMNSRPLTHVGIDPSDPEPLTPNHFLLGRAHSHVPLDVVTTTEGLSRRNWRLTQYIGPILGTMDEGIRSHAGADAEQSREPTNHYSRQHRSRRRPQCASRTMVNGKGGPPVSRQRWNTKGR
ncbi:hypothetical protein M513_07232 [Trichuris suis]|uniref:Integrase catalytic domain-containing protein n=1 Tax=Trichuris suis TaxID=68888 RepID=A0A085M3V7_9BILA|nr:hypothetical protein M513_07232 [Trichuris suis]